MSEFKDIYTKEAHALLLKEMRTGAWAHVSHLPRESELATIMGISRTQLRDILAVLECEGFITRRHGVGTLINRHVLNLPTRVDMEQEFMDMIYAGGNTPSVAFTKSEQSAATAEEAKKLNLQPGTEVLRIAKLCTASKKPALYCEDLFDASLLRAPITEQALRAPVFQLLQDNCRINCFMDISQMKAIVADDRIADILQIAPGTPLMYIEEVDFDIDGNPVLFSHQYFVNDYFQHNLIRKRL